MARRQASKREEGTMNPNIGIADKDRTGIVKILNTLLADEYVLYTKTRSTSSSTASSTTWPSARGSSAATRWRR